MRCPSCQATWLAPGTGRTSRSASDSSSRYLVSRNFVEPRADRIASHPVTLVPSWNQGARRTGSTQRYGVIVGRTTPPARRVDFFPWGLATRGGALVVE